MKIILSHDVDHLNIREHLTKDLILQKFYVRSLLEFSKGMIGMNELLLRFADFYKNKWNSIEEIIQLHQSLDIKSSFFVGVANGRGLNYHHTHAAHWIKFIKEKGFEVGVHGIAYDNQIDMQSEYDLFRKYFGKGDFGIRMHYLKMTPDTLTFTKNCGYLYDSTVHEFRNPYYKDNLLLFPLQIMDVWVMSAEKRWQHRNLEQAKEYTLRELDKAHQCNLNYLSILFHDVYYRNSFKTWKDWYDWLLKYLVDNKCEFVDYRTAKKEIDLLQ